MSRLDPAQWSTAPKPDKAFGGSTYDPKRDYVRLSGQLGRVFDAMKDGEWRTLGQIWNLLSYSRDGSDTLPAISARLRDLRKPEYGSHTVERKSLGGGLWSYRLLVRKGRDAA